MAAILEAGAELFSSRGYAGATTNAIAVRAGVSVGSLYQYFPGKDAILAALLERHLSDVDRIIEAGLRDVGDPRVPLRHAVRTLLQRSLSLHASDPRMRRAEEIARQVPNMPDLAHAHATAYVDELARALDRRAEVRDGDRRLMATILFEAAESVATWLTHAAGEASWQERALNEATELLCRYVE